MSEKYKIGHKSLRSRHPIRCQGFTLLEVLVAITILGLLLLSATGALRLGNRSWEAGLKRSSKILESRVATEFLRRNITQILPLVQGEGSGNNIIFSGEKDELRFVAPAPIQRPGMGMTEYLIAVEETAEGKNILVYYHDHSPDKKEFSVSTDSDSVTLVKGLKRANFGYYGKGIARSDARWHEEWSRNAVQFPQNIRLETEFQNTRRQWPVLVFNVPSRVK